MATKSTTGNSKRLATMESLLSTKVYNTADVADIDSNYQDFVYDIQAHPTEEARRYYHKTIEDFYNQHRHAERRKK